MTKLTQKKLEYLTRLFNKFEYANKMSPFPIYGTEEVMFLKLTIDKMKEQDNETVECCADCKSLGLYEEEEGKVWCIKCNSLNKLEILPNINYWKRQYGHIWI